MKLLKYLALVLVFVLAFSVTSACSFALPQNNDEVMVEIVDATIISVNNSTVTVNINGETLDLLAKGGWLIVTSKIVDKGCWGKAKDYVTTGDALIAYSTIVKDDETFNVLAGLKQDENLLFRFAYLKHEAKVYKHTCKYLSVKGQIVDKGDNYLIIEKNGLKGLVVTGGEWFKAGYGEVTWEDVADEFNVNDEIRIFCHNILIMNENFAKTFGIDGFVWGYSGAIINLSNGVALSKI